MENNLRTILFGTRPFSPKGKRGSEHDSSCGEQAIGWASFSAHRLWARAHLLLLHSITPPQAQSPGPAHGLVNMDLTKKSPRMVVANRVWLTPGSKPSSYQFSKAKIKGSTSSSYWGTIRNSGRKEGLQTHRYKGLSISAAAPDWLMPEAPHPCPLQGLGRSLHC